MLSGCTVLIVEHEYLIALDIQRILESANVTQSVIIASFAEAEAELPDMGMFNLAIIPSPESDPVGVAFVERLRAARTPFVISSADGALTQSLRAEGGPPVVGKPFSDEDLIAACREAISGSTATARHRLPPPDCPSPAGAGS